MLEHSPYDQNPSGRTKIRPLIFVLSMRSERGTTGAGIGSGRLAAGSPQGENLQAAERVNSDSKHNRICDLNSVGNTEGTVSECQECLTDPIDFPLDRSIVRVELS